MATVGEVNMDLQNHKEACNKFEVRIENSLKEIENQLSNITTLLEEYVSKDQIDAVKQDNTIKNIKTTLGILEKETEVIRLFTKNKKLAILSAVGGVLIILIAIGAVDITSKKFSISKQTIESAEVVKQITK